MKTSLAKYKTATIAFALATALQFSLTSLQAGLVGFYSFDDPADSMKDDSGNGNTLLKGLAGPNTNSDPVYVSGGGVEGGAFYFDGTRRLGVPIDINPDVMPQLTMGAWVKTTSLTAAKRKVLGNDDGGLDRAVGLDTRNGQFRYTAFRGYGGHPIPTTAAPRNTNDWTFLAATYDQANNQMVFYVDLDALSVGDALQAFASATCFSNGFQAVAIGGLRTNSNAEPWIGSIDNVFFYNEVLTPEQLTNIRNRGKGAILGSGGEDPDLRVAARPEFLTLPKSPAVQSLTCAIQNVGSGQPLAISAVTITGANAGRFQVVSFPATVAAGGSAPIELAFDSQGQAGTSTANLVIDSNDPTQPKTTLPLLAQVADDPNLFIGSYPALKELPSQPTPHSLVFGITNTGYVQSLTIQGVTLTGLDAAYYTVRNFPSSLTPGQGGTIEIELNPQGQVGVFSAAATVQSSDEGTPAMVLDLSTRVTGLALVGFYPFDDSAKPLRDASESGHMLQTLGGIIDPTFVDGGGISGSCYEFDGAQRLTVPIDINPARLPQLAMGAWVRTTAADAGLYKVLGHDDGGSDRVIGLDTRVDALGGQMAAGTFRYAAFTGDTTVKGTGPTQGDPAPAPLGAEYWTFIAGVYDQINDELTFYVDLDAATTNDAPQAVTVSTSMGSGATTASIGSCKGASNSEGWVGMIDNVFFLAGRPTPETIAKIRNQGASALLEMRADPLLAVTNAVNLVAVTNNALLTNTLILANNGSTKPLKIAEARLTGRDANRFIIGALPTEIAAGATANLQVSFNPQGFEGPFEASIELISNSADGRSTTISLKALVPYQALIAFYPFDDPKNPLKNVTGKGADLTVPAGAGPTYNATGGIEGGAYVFSGTQRLVSLVDINPLVQPKLTMGAWVKTSSLVSGRRKVIGADNGSYDRCVGLDDRNGAFRYTTWLGGTTPPLGGTPAPESTNAWTFLAVSYDEDLHSLTLYVDLDVSTTNDALVATESATGFGPSYDTTAIGGYRPTATSEGWKGSIDNVFFFQYVLTAEELTRIRNEGSIAILPSIFRIDAVRKTDKVELTWNSTEGVTYAVQYAEQLGSTWTSISTVQGESGHTTFSDTDATRAARPQGYYRVELKQ